jgi:hypothetical protein
VLALATEFAFIKTFLYGLDLVANASVVLLVSGLVRIRQPVRSSGIHLTGIRISTEPSGSKEWDDKVKELAERGITLEALLDFYSGLGQHYMLHFNPDVHSTADVVRQAIIPLTASTSTYGPCALSTLFMDGASIPAQCMVTHSWSNKFADLIAAIVADALGLSTYEAVLPMLKRDAWPVLIRELHQLGVLVNTYWVCAVCVNQHAGICSGNPRQDRDPVSGEVHLVCSCGHPKFWNNTPPLRHDGEGIMCEMNKFDDMMLYLNASVPHFRQVIAVDREFSLFNRAWCVSEIHLAHSSYISAAVKCHTHESLNLHQSELMGLRVQDMDSSRPEDKNMIIARIDDLDDFNETLAWIILDEDTGIFAYSMDSVRASDSLGRITRRSSSFSSSGSFSSDVDSSSFSD